jgi:hypothetical protein
MDSLANLTKLHLTATQVAEVLELAYPIKEVNAKLAFYEANSDDLTDEQKDRLITLKQQALNERRAMLTTRLGVWESYERFNSDNPVTSATGWALYNAVTENECWKIGGTSEAEAARSVLSGTRGATMARAYSALTALK